MSHDVSREAIEQAGLDVSHETQNRLERFVALLLRWNRRINLVGEKAFADIWSRHVADSLQLRPLVPADTDRAIDLGSGAGFPGLVLAIASGIPFDLIEADHRKAAFLREAARETTAPVRIHAIRAEQARLSPAPLVTARAVAALPALLALAAPLLAPGGVCLFPKGASVENELTATRARWQMRIERFPSRTSRGPTILRLSEIEPCRSPRMRTRPTPRS